MNRVVDRLTKAFDLAWSDLKPAFRLAIVQAEQAEYEAARAANLAQCSVQPAYPPLVVALSESVAE